MLAFDPVRFYMAIHSDSIQFEQSGSPICLILSLEVHGDRISKSKKERAFRLGTGFCGDKLN